VLPIELLTFGVDVRYWSSEELSPDWVELLGTDGKLLQSLISAVMTQPAHSRLSYALNRIVDAGAGLGAGLQEQHPTRRRELPTLFLADLRLYLGVTTRSIASLLLPISAYWALSL